MFYSSGYVQERGGKWRGGLRYKDGSGKWRTVTKTLTATGKRAATRELAEWRGEMEREHDRLEGRGAGASTDTAKYVAAFVDALERGAAIERSTVRGYRSTLTHIRREFEGTALADLEPARIQAWEIGLTESGLSSSTVGKAHRLLKQALSHAVNAGDLERNPMATVKPPKRQPKHAGINALDSTGYRRTLERLNELNQTTTTVAATLALCTGLREGEICGLQWGDLNAESGALRVERSIGEGPGGSYVKRPKTDRARTIYLPRPALDALRVWRFTKATEWQEFGLDGPSAHDYIIGYPDGRYLPPTVLSREWNALSKALGVMGTAGRRCTFHDLRHTWATLFIASGGDAVTAANNLGHASPSMTLNIYAAADPNAQRQAPRLIEGIIGGADAQGGSEQA
ncbi:MAG: tyrosine-type recombinase/integrase [Coriobacteriaceae bacterium]|nr:tyrosine-type recombinase/integrase [Coriobacteriaceae bacterium]